MNPIAGSNIEPDTRIPVKWKCWAIPAEHYVYFLKKRCKYCQPVYAGDPDADKPVVR